MSLLSDLPREGIHSILPHEEPHLQLHVLVEDGLRRLYREHVPLLGEGDETGGAADDLQQTLLLHQPATGMGVVR